LKKDAFYFPHFSNARHDLKLLRVRKELGVEGYGIYFMLLESLRDKEMLSIPVSDLDVLAHDFGTSEQKVRTVVFNYDLFITNEIDGEQVFTSQRFIEYLEPYFKMKEQRKLAGIASGKARKRTVVKRLLNENEQKKGKERKVNYNYQDEFDRWWSLYPKKTNKASAKKSFQKAYKAHGEKVFMLEHPSLKNKDLQYIPYASTFLNQERFLDDPVQPGPEETKKPKYQVKKLQTCPDCGKPVKYGFCPACQKEI
jgi:hypothetical protein